MNISFYTLGCKVNQYETEILTEKFTNLGYQINDAAKPDIIVINSCTVTASGDKKTRQLLRRLRRENPSAVIALTGCYPQAFPQEAAELHEADIITGSRNRSKLPELVSRALSGEKPIIEIIAHENKENFENMSSAGMDRTRAFVKIEDGCNHHCAYCIIPTARGPVRSKPLEDLKSELNVLAQAGHKEVVLAGINLASYGKDTGSSLMEAVRAACAVPGILRVRLGSMEPDLLTYEDIAFMSKLPKLCPQFHLSLQSGCDATLRRMRRRYDTEFYRNVIKQIRSCFENPSITTDIMVGFPGETDEEFSQSLAFAEEIKFSDAHVFAYSPRSGTPAAEMPDQVPNHIKAERSHAMQEVISRLHQSFLQGMVGKTEEILVENSTTPLAQEGYTPNYTKVHISHTEILRRNLVTVFISEVENGECRGYVIK